MFTEYKQNHRENDVAQNVIEKRSLTLVHHELINTKPFGLILQVLKPLSAILTNNIPPHTHTRLDPDPWLVKPLNSFNNPKRTDYPPGATEY